MKKLFLSIALLISAYSFAQTGVSVQKVTPTVETKVIFSELTLTKDNVGKLSARVRFSVLDADNNVIENLFYYRTGDDFNTFWNGFTTGKYLYSQLELRNSSGSLVAIPNSVENDFVNP